MAVRGNRPRPRRWKVLEGREKAETLENEANFADSLQRPSPEAFFNARAEAEWNYLDNVCPKGLLKAADASTILAHCNAVAQYLEATRLLAENGQTEVGEKGNVVRSPWVIIQRQQYEILRQTAVEMGLTPSARVRVDVDPVESGKVDDWQRLVRDGLIG